MFLRKVSFWRRNAFLCRRSLIIGNMLSLGGGTAYTSFPFFVLLGFFTLFYFKLVISASLVQLLV